MPGNRWGSTCAPGRPSRTALPTARMSRDISACRRRKSTEMPCGMIGMPMMPCGMIGMPMWLGRMRRRAAVGRPGRLRRRKPPRFLAAAAGRPSPGSRGSGPPEDDLHRTIFHRSAAQHSTDRGQVQAHSLQHQQREEEDALTPAQPDAETAPTIGRVATEATARLSMSGSLPSWLGLAWRRCTCSFTSRS
jgi:hypothetical protein